MENNDYIVKIDELLCLQLLIKRLNQVEAQ